MKKMKLIPLIIVLVIIVGVGSLAFYKMTTPKKIETQHALEKSWKDELSSGDYTIENPLIIQNPYDSNELAAYVAFKFDEAVSYEYTVNGNVPFTYSNEEETKTVIIPIVGLYNDAVNKIDLTLFSDGEQVKNSAIEIDTTNTKINSELNTADISDETAELKEFMSGKFFMDNYTNLYDENGDLRATAIAPDSDYAYLKIIDDQLLVADKTVKDTTYRTILFSYNIMGRINPDFFFEAPEGTKFHHDIAQVGDKLYTLTSPIGKDSDYQDSYKESLITIYSISSGKELETIDMTDFYNVSNVDMTNKGANAGDIHLNSLDYYEKENILIIDSRSYSQIIGYDLDTNEVSWIIDDADTVGEDHKDLLLTPVGDMEYLSGEHTVFVANDYIDSEDKQEGMLYLSIFDNRQCINSDEKEYVKDLSENQDMLTCAEADQFNSRGLVYEIDLENRTVSTFKEIEFNSRSSFKGGFNMLPDGYKTTYVANAKKFEIYNKDDELIGVYTLHTKEELSPEKFATLTQEEIEEAEEEAFLYRAITLSTEEVQSLVEFN